MISNVDRLTAPSENHKSQGISPSENSPKKGSNQDCFPDNRSAKNDVDK
jgi:hypothetical protein